MFSSIQHLSGLKGQPWISSRCNRSIPTIVPIARIMVLGRHLSTRVNLTQQIPSPHTKFTREDRDSLRSLEDGSSLTVDDRWFAGSSTRIALTSALEDQNSAGNLQIHRGTSNLPGSEQGVAVRYSTGPIVTFPEVPSFVTSSYMPPATVIDSAVISHSCVQAIPYGYAISAAATGSPIQSRWPWTAASVFNLQSFVNPPDTTNAASTIQSKMYSALSREESLPTDSTARRHDVHMAFGTRKIKFSPVKSRLLNEELTGTAQMARDLRHCLEPISEIGHLFLTLYATFLLATKQKDFLMIFSESNGRTLHKIICLVQNAVKDGLKEGKTKDQHQSLVQNSTPRLQLWFKVLLTAHEVKRNIAPDRVVRLGDWEADYLL
jgi:hypothetical protein